MRNSLKRHGWEHIDQPGLLEQMEEEWVQRNGVRKSQTRLEKKEWEIGRYQRLLASLHESLAEGIIDRDEYTDLKKTYSMRLSKATEQAEDIRAELKRAKAHSATRQEWRERLLRRQDMIPLDRASFHH